MPKRSWFQLHLATVALLPFVAGGILYLNLQPFQIEAGHGTTHYKGVVYENDYRIFVLGWPEPHCRKFVYGVPQILPHHFLIARGLYTDIGVGVGILIAFAICAEFVLRRLDRAKSS